MKPRATDASGSVVAALARALGLDFARLGEGQRACFYLVLVTCVLNLAGSIYDFCTYGGTDLRARILGARQILRGDNPYTLTWSDDLPATLQDPNQEHAGLSRCTYPPSLLLLYMPFAALPYPWQRGLWMVLEWAAMLTTLALAVRLLRAARARFLFVLVGLGLFASSYFWRLHVERGQYYIFLALLLVAAMLVCLRRRGAHWLGGALLGIAIAMRPTMVLVLVPLVLGRLRRTAVAAVIAAALVVGISLPTAGLSTWRQYLWMIGEYEKGMIDEAYLNEHYPPITPPQRAVDGFVPVFMDSLSVNLAFSNGCEPLVAQGVSRDSLIVTLRGTLVAIVGLFSLCFGLAQRARPFSVRQCLLAGIFLMLLADYFAPIRVGYVDVLFVVPLALVMPMILRGDERFYLGLLIASFLLAVIPIAPETRAYWKVATLMRSLTVVLICGRALAAAILPRLRHQLRRA